MTTKIAALALTVGLIAPAVAGANSDAWNAPWFGSLVHAESLMAGAVARGAADSAAAGAVLDQVRHGALALRAMLGATLSADTLLADPFTAPPPPAPRQGQWGNWFVRTTGIVAVASHLVNIAASMQGASHETRTTLAYVGGSAGGVGALFNMLRPRSAPPPPPDPNERIRTISREWLLRETCAEGSRAVESVLAELQSIDGAPCTTRTQVNDRVRRYAGALQRASVVIDLQVAHAATMARSCGEYPVFSAAARARLAAYANRLDGLAATWHERRALFSRSEWNALGYLVLADRRQ